VCVAPYASSMYMYLLLNCVNANIYFVFVDSYKQGCKSEMTTSHWSKGLQSIYALCNFLFATKTQVSTKDFLKQTQFMLVPYSKRLYLIAAT